MFTRAEYNGLAAQGYTHIPLVEQFSTTDSPADIYIKLARNGMSYLLESGDVDMHWGRYSFIGCDCQTHIRVNGHQIILNQKGVDTEYTVADPLTWIEDYSKTFRVPVIANLPRFAGGLVGYFGYETIQYIEPKLKDIELPDKLGTPDIFLMVSESLAVLDNISNQLTLIQYADTSDPKGYELAQQKIETMKNKLAQAPIPSNPPQMVPTENDFVSLFGKQNYINAVERCLRYISDGEAMQIVLSQRMQAPFKCPAFNLYKALHQLNPSPYMYHLDFGDFQVVGSSPEILVRLDDNELTVRPIAGTRRRGKTEEEDVKFEKELLTDEKELAEHLMLIDLGRNDLGRICRTGTVKVTEKMKIERYSHVMHIVSNVVGQRCDDVGLVKVLRATFPAGTVSGAPKVRAMEIIAEFEPIKRNIYSGAIGYLGWDGAIDTAIAIRTAVIKDNTLYVQTGAGLVYDSNPAYEWMETMNKARVLLKAAELAGKIDT